MHLAVAAALRGLDGPPDTLRRHRHLDVPHTYRVADSVDDAGGISTHIGSTRGALSHSRARDQMRRMVAGPVRDYTSGAVVLPDWHVQEMIFRLIASGVFERFPKLRFVCAEFEAGWAASMLAHLDAASFGQGNAIWSWLNSTFSRVFEVICP